MQLTVLLAETLRQLSVDDQDPTGVQAFEARHLFHSIIDKWTHLNDLSSDLLKQQGSNLAQPYANIHGVCSHRNFDIIQSFVAAANVGLGMLLIWQTRLEEALICFGKATWAAPSSTSSFTQANERQHWNDAARFQHGINIGTVAAVWLFLGSKEGAKLLLERASVLVDIKNNAFGFCTGAYTDIQHQNKHLNILSKSFAIAWLCSNIGMLKMGNQHSSLEKSITVFSQSILVFDRLLHHYQMERSRIPMTQTILGLADTIAIEWRDIEKAKILSEQAAYVLKTNKTSSLTAAMLVKCMDRVKMFSKLLNSSRKPSENHARFTYLTAERTMMSDMFVGDGGTIYLRQP